MLENALASHLELMQPSALYNLGHTRFRQGAAELKKQADAGSLVRHGGQVTRQGQEALTEADAALASNEVIRMVAAYLRGRGVRRQLKQAREAVQQALETYGVALQKWERASGDFHSAVELAPADSDAKTNAAIVDRNIAQLVDRITLMQQVMQAMRDRQQQLGEKLKELKGRIPASELPPNQPGDGDDEEEDDEGEPQRDGPQQGQQEPRGQDGTEMTLTPEQAAWLLDGYRLDSERRLPMGQQSQEEPRKRNRAEW
jgi:chromosome segregation ATPase